MEKPHSFAGNVAATRPILRLTRRPIDIVMELIALLAIAATWGMIAFSWKSLPDRVPSHFDFAGKPDAWSGRWVLLLLPAIAVAVYAMLTGIRSIPHRFNYPWRITPENAARQYRMAVSLIVWLKTEVVFMFAYLTWETIHTAQGNSVGIGRFFLPVVIGGLFATIAIYMVAAARAR